VPYGNHNIEAVSDSYYAAESFSQFEEDDVIYINTSEVTDYLHHFTARRSRPKNNAEKEALRTFYTNYASALPPANYQFYAITTRKFILVINGCEYCAMIDTGSEINVASIQIPSETGLSMDSEGMYWAMQGMHRSAEALLGCLTNVPMVIGRHIFKHHLFIVSSSNIRNHLVQSFLHWFHADPQLFHLGEVVLFL
jgi:hypothetical protein